MDHRVVRIVAHSSNITRAPWFVAADTPQNAHVFSGCANLRYVLP